MTSVIAIFLFSSPQSALGNIVSRSGPYGLVGDNRQIYKFDAAFDSVNGVYLIVWGTQSFGPTNGLFVDVNGNVVGQRFDISGGGQWAGWARVTFAPEEGKFLVTYTKILGWNSHQRVARFVTYQSPSSRALSQEIVIDSWTGGAGGQPGLAYTPPRAGRDGRFLVTWWNDNEFPPQTYVAALDPAGNILSKFRISTPGDGQTDSEIACDAARDRCMVIGFSWGMFTNALPGTWGNYISASTGQPLGSGFIIDSWRDENDASITFSAAGDRFIVAFARNFKTIWGVTVDAGSLQRSAPYLLKASTDANADGGGYGRPRMAYNSGSQTVMVSMIPWMARSAVLELDQNGSPGAFDMMPQVAHYDHGTKDLLPAAHAASQRFLVADNQDFLTLRAAVYTVGTGGGPAPCSYSLSSASQSFGSGGGVGGFTLTTGASCTWNASSAAGWLAPSSSNASGTGPKTIAYTVAANSSTSARTGSITVGGQTFTVTQAGAVVDPFSAREWSRADINRDGLSDLLWQNIATGQLAVWMLNGTTVKIEAGLSHMMPDVNWQVVGTGDFNGDSKPDILWRHKLQGYLGVWYMNGTTVIGSESLSVPQVADTAWKIVAVADLNLDGSPDIVWQHDTGPVVLWAMQGVRAIYTTQLSGAPMTGDAGWRIVGAADMNYDGHMDLLWQHNDGRLATWLMIRTDIWQVHGLNPGAEYDTSWRVVATIDAYRDGRYDIVWQHVSGSVLLWGMDGLTRVHTATIGGGSLGGSNWKVVGPK